MYGVRSQNLSTDRYPTYGCNESKVASSFDQRTSNQEDTTTKGLMAILLVGSSSLLAGHLPVSFLPGNQNLDSDLMYFLDTKNETLDRLDDLLSFDQDLAPITIDEVQFDHGTLSRIKPLSFFPSRSVSGRYLEITREELGISVAALNRVDLINALRDAISVLWEEYVTEDSSKLSGRTLGIKNNLKGYFKEV